MIVCNRCGKKNDEDARACESCGRKLQSSHRPASVEDSSNWLLSSFRHGGIDPRARASLQRMIEAWAYVAVLGGVGVACLVYEVWWPLYPAVGALGLAVWLRRI